MSIINRCDDWYSNYNGYSSRTPLAFTRSCSSNAGWSFLALVSKCSLSMLEAFTVTLFGVLELAA